MSRRSCLVLLVLLAALAPAAAEPVPALDPAVARIYDSLAGGRVEQAYRDALALATLKPGDLDVALALAWAAADTMRWDEAARRAERLIDRDSRWASPHLVLAKASFATGDESQGRVSLQQAYRLDPDDRAIAAFHDQRARIHELGFPQIEQLQRDERIVLALGQRLRSEDPGDVLALFDPSFLPELGPRQQEEVVSTFYRELHREDRSVRFEGWDVEMRPGPDGRLTLHLELLIRQRFDAAWAERRRAGRPRLTDAAVPGLARILSLLTPAERDEVIARMVGTVHWEIQELDLVVTEVGEGGRIADVLMGGVSMRGALTKRLAGRARPSRSLAYRAGQLGAYASIVVVLILVLRRRKQRAAAPVSG